MTKEELEPREDVLYAGLRRLNSVLTLRQALDAPLASLLTIIVFGILCLVLVTAITLTVSLQISRDTSVSTTNQLIMKSQLDFASICADDRFRPLFEDSIYVNEEKFTYRLNAGDFFNSQFVSRE